MSSDRFYTFRPCFFFFFVINEGREGLKDNPIFSFAGSQSMRRNFLTAFLMCVSNGLVFLQVRQLKYVPTARIARQPGDQNGGRRADDRDPAGEHGEERRRLLSVFSSAPDTRPTGNRYRTRALDASGWGGRVCLANVQENPRSITWFASENVLGDFHGVAGSSIKSPATCQGNP